MPPLILMMTLPTPGWPAVAEHNYRYLGLLCSWWNHGASLWQKALTVSAYKSSAHAVCFIPCPRMMHSLPEVLAPPGGVRIKAEQWWCHRLLEDIPSSDKSSLHEFWSQFSWGILMEYQPWMEEQGHVSSCIGHWQSSHARSVWIENSWWIYDGTFT